MKKTTLIIVAFIMLSTTIFAQMDATWEAKANSSIRWNKFTPNGNLICGTENEETIAFNPKTGEQIWKKSFDYGSFEILPNTPYIYFDSEKTGLLVIDAINGKEICNSELLGMENIGSS
ncbi:PQQ-like beta-propeller repeat protein [Lentimicrobium sp. S6]|uniref:PQQ-like beta-propeller repeat protein n=1 Tax=Lentimicrobium sp. S6 TaxID=2735872 RepID=UPI001552DE99|nr:PQQ-like beta-propeller repeat protein [Lentimicrobium sp. S6]NPD47869.1 PQQ-like beta-propeller repeat protein [Lentimicrobium sp. S6]